jgi:hypothetical protein
MTNSTEPGETKRRRNLNRTREPMHDRPRGSKTVCLPLDRESYQQIMFDATAFRGFLDGERPHSDQMHEGHPELFPQGMAEGYTLHDILPLSHKLPDIRLRRFKLKANQEVYTLRPSFVLPYMTGYTDDVENGLFLLSFGVPHWAIARVFGRDAMYWERLTERLGHNSLVGTTVRQAETLPEHLLADEKHTHLAGEKAYIATTVGGDSVLAVAMSPTASQSDLQEAYGQFKTEAQNLTPDYQPQTVNTDGWKATMAAWLSLFPHCVLVLCFLHAFIKIRDRCKRLDSFFPTICDKVWDAYHAATPAGFHAKVADLAAWASQTLPDGVALNAILKLCLKADPFVIAYDFPDAYRTSNMIDRHVNDMDRFLFAGYAFHGHLMTAEYRIRAWALLHNFRPYSLALPPRHCTIGVGHRFGQTAAPRGHPNRRLIAKVR